MVSLSGAETATVKRQLKVPLVHNPGLSMTWTRQEQATLEEELKKHSSDVRVNHYAQIANTLPNKTIRDVALRCRWMAEKNMGPFARSSNPLARENISMGNNHGVTNNDIGGPIGQLLKQNSQAFQRVSENFNSSQPVLQLEENNMLLYNALQNIQKLLNCMKDVPGGQDRMPSLSLYFNGELANAVLYPGVNEKLRVHMADFR